MTEQSLEEAQKMQQEEGGAFHSFVSVSILLGIGAAIVFGFYTLDQRSVKSNAAVKAETILAAESAGKDLFVSQGFESSSSVFIGAASHVRIGQKARPAMIGCEYSKSGDVKVLANISRPTRGGDVFRLYDITDWMTDVSLCKTVATWAPEAYLKLDLALMGG